MAALASDGTIVLSVENVAQLRELVRRWEQGDGALIRTVALVDLGYAIRDLLDGLPVDWAAQQ